jgi:hypothetical protein
MQEECMLSDVEDLKRIWVMELRGGFGTGVLVGKRCERRGRQVYGRTD